mmetsp:Transcript_13324/g.20575  ORF Transcript_13324/g.20575 Transcript_13324/m.20575 type:complete len:280 (-) Transcript_13324:457-1296(-)
MRIVISIAIVRMMLLLQRLRVRMDSFPITTMKHGISSIMAMKLLVRIVTRRRVVIVILCATNFSSLVVWPRPFIGRIVGRIVLVLSVSIRMMIHHHVMMMMTAMTMVVIALILMVWLKAVVYSIKVPLIPIISIVSIVFIRHPDMLVLIIKLLHHHVFATGIVATTKRVTACGGGVMVNLRFACFDFAALTEDVQYTSLPWDIVEKRVCHFLIGKSNKAEATAPLCITIHHDNGINDFPKFLKELKELFIIDVSRQPPNKQLAWIRLSWWCALPLPLNC